MLERHFVIQRDSRNFAILNVILTADKDDVAGINTVAGHGITLRNQGKVARQIILDGDELRAVAGLVNRLAAGGTAQNRHAPAPGRRGASPAA